MKPQFHKTVVSVLVLAACTLLPTATAEDGDESRRSQDESAAGIINDADLRDLEKAIKDAGEGDPASQFRLGNFYYVGDNGAEKSPTVALSWFQKAADQGYAQAEYALGLMNMNAEGGLVQDMAEAFNWFEKAANQNDAGAQYYLGSFYLHGDGVDEADPVQAAAWLLKAAAQGIPDAQQLIATLFVAASHRQLLNSLCRLHPFY
jgi:TPR repeat protein